ncbi:MAG TPA: hypothetical protein VEX12_07200 [Microbacterium sp.]|jgi:hypothetical protein|nr:hypothetical protein [Microbacterium sp.]
MLSTVYSSEMQFRHDADTRERELALLASIRERRAAETARAIVHVATPVALHAEPRRAAARVTRATWPRPIGVKTVSPAACAVA